MNRLAFVCFVMVASSTWAARPFIFVLDDRDSPSIKIAKIDSSDFSVSCKSPPLATGVGSVWGIGGSADASRIYVTVPGLAGGNGSLAVLNGNDCSLASNL